MELEQISHILQSKATDRTVLEEVKDRTQGLKRRLLSEIKDSSPDDFIKNGFEIEGELDFVKMRTSFYFMKILVAMMSKVDLKAETLGFIVE